MKQIIDRVVYTAINTMDNIHRETSDRVAWFDVWHECCSELELMIRQEVRKRGRTIPVEPWEQKFYLWLVLDKLSDLKDEDEPVIKFERLSDIITELIPIMKDHYENLPGAYTELISLQEILFALGGHIMDFDLIEANSYINFAIDKIKDVYQLA